MSDSMNVIEERGIRAYLRCEVGGVYLEIPTEYPYQSMQRVRLTEETARKFMPCLSGWVVLIVRPEE